MNETIRIAGACVADPGDGGDEAEGRGEAVRRRGRGDGDDDVRHVAERAGLEALRARGARVDGRDARRRRGTLHCVLPLVDAANGRATPVGSQCADLPKHRRALVRNGQAKDVCRGPFVACLRHNAGATLDRPANESSETEPPKWRTQRSGRTPRRASRSARGATSGCTSRASARDPHAPLPIIVSGRGLLRLRRRRQALPRRPLGALLRERRARPRRARGGGGDADARARLLHELELRAPARDRARRAHRRASRRATATASSSPRAAPRRSSRR